MFFVRLSWLEPRLVCQTRGKEDMQVTAVGAWHQSSVSIRARGRESSVVLDLCPACHQHIRYARESSESANHFLWRLKNGQATLYSTAELRCCDWADCELDLKAM